jgi:TolA-binding protein
MLAEAPVIAISAAVSAEATKSASAKNADREHPASAEARKKAKEGKRGEAIALLASARDGVEGTARGDLSHQLGYMKLAAKDESGAEDEFTAVARGIVSATPEKKADATLRLGFLRLKKGDKDAALKEFEKVATGKVAATSEATTEAALRLGSLLRTGRDSRNAISVYRQIAKQARKQESSLYANLQLAGLLLEAVHSNNIK